jgi:DNA-binding NarL/FixJ family response regulator
VKVSGPDTASVRPVRVMVVDDHPIWRDAVARDLVEAGYDVTAVVGEGAQAIRVAPAARPDVVVLDLQLPDLPGVEVVRRLIATDPAIRVLMLSASGEQQDVLDALKAGAVGYLVKSAKPAQLVEAVARTAAGDPVFTVGLAGLVLGEYRRLGAVSASPADTPRLTGRETEVLRLVAKGLSYKQIAERLVVSHRTVQNHVQNTLGKLQLHNRVELTRYAIEQGFDQEGAPCTKGNSSASPVEATATGRPASGGDELLVSKEGVPYGDHQSGPGRRSAAGGLGRSR